MSQRRILYTGAFRFPDGDAAAFRVLAVARLAEAVGGDATSVDFAGWESRDREYHHIGHRCFPQGEFREREVGIVTRLTGFLLRGARTLQWLREHQDYQVVIAYNPPALFALRLLWRARRDSFTAVLDSTEWYDGRHLPGGRLGPAAFENWLRMRVVYPRFQHVICISRFLERHFRGRNVVNVPPLVEAADGATSEADRPDLTQGVVFIYAGNPGKKDRLLDFLAALPTISARLGCPVRLNLVGPDHRALRQWLLDAGASTEAILPLIECHGRLQRGEVFALYRRSHFSVLFRENARYAWAGFPTKAVESWALGCPVISNRVGDVGEIVEHGRTGLLVDEDRLTEELVDALAAVIAGRRHPAMVAASRELARSRFTPTAQQGSFRRFLERIHD